MKLFKSLLVAPATLGLLAPLSATANEVTINDFNTVVESTLIAGGEGLVDAESYDGGFSDTTTASMSAQFVLEATDENTSSEKAIFSYQFGMDLSTSFTGEDSLDLTIETGNAAGPNYLGLNDSSTFGDTLKVDGIAYTFPLGEKTTITVGDAVDASANFSTACSYSALLDYVSDCGTGSSAGAGGDVGISAGYDVGNGFTVGAGLSASDGATTSGILTKEGTDIYALQMAYATDSYGVSVSYADNDVDTFWGVNASYTFEDTALPSISVGYESQDDADISTEKNQIFVGLTFSEVGAGSLSLGMNTTGLTGGSDTDYYYYEASYSYPLNDGMTITPGVFVKEKAADDETGVVLSTTFSF